MTNLDDIKALHDLDAEGMLAALWGLPEQCRAAWQAAKDFKIPASYRDIDKVLVLGMGGSAIGGDLVRSITEGEARIPIIVHRDYNLPHFVSENTLVIASSYSGNTEETLSGYRSAVKVGAKLIVITTGGRLGELAVENGTPTLTNTYQGQPRAAIGFGVFPILMILQKVGLLWDKRKDTEEAFYVLERLRDTLNESVPLKDNPAKQMAERLVGKLPIIYGSGFTSESAHRWKTQINENAKIWAFHEAFPELNHNASVGFQYPREIAENVRVIFLVGTSMNRRMKLRYEVTAELLEQAGVGYDYIQAEGEGSLAQVMSLVYLGDYVSCYLAMKNGTDPTPVEAIDFLKKRLADA